MKKLMAGLVLLVMLGVCSSSFGYILVYNFSATVKGVDVTNTTINPDGNSPVTIPLMGYVIVDLDDTTSDLLDANLIIYGKDSNTPKKQKVYVQLNYSGSGIRFNDEAWSLGNYFFVHSWPEDPFNFSCLISGKAKTQNVGPLVDSQYIASSYNGVMIVFDGFLLGPNAHQSVSGTANNLSEPLNVLETKWANGNNNQHAIKTLDQVVAKIIGELELKGYKPAVLP